MLSLGVLVSGRGSNLQALLDACASGRLDARVALVLSNVAGVFALERAARAGVSSVVVDHRTFPSREDFDAAVVRELRAREVEMVVLAGFMRLVTPVFLDAFPDRVLNVHPALLPSFPGTHAQAQALAHGVKVTGCTVHLVDAGMDTGPIVLQRAVPVLDGDDEAALAQRILEAEHGALVDAVALFAAGHARVTRAPGVRARVRTGGGA
jgi:phosphoribosylglycinamide formyltransferase 1